MNSSEHKAAAEEILSAIDEGAEKLGDDFSLTSEQLVNWNTMVNAHLARAQIHATLAAIPDTRE